MKKKNEETGEEEDAEEEREVEVEDGSGSVFEAAGVSEEDMAGYAKVLEVLDAGVKSAAEEAAAAAVAGGEGA